MMFFYSECLFILRCYFNELDAKSPYRHGIICSEKTHIYFKGKGGGSSRILCTFLKMSFFALLTVTLKALPHVTISSTISSTISLRVAGP